MLAAVLACPGSRNGFMGTADIREAVTFPSNLLVPRSLLRGGSLRSYFELNKTAPTLL